MKEIGTYRHYENCRFCNNTNIIKIIDLGFVPLAGGFLQKNTSKSKLLKEKFYPLDIYFCSKSHCTAAFSLLLMNSLHRSLFKS